MSATYICAECKGEHEYAREPGEAEEEMLQLWGPLAEHEKVVVCEDCWVLLMAGMNTSEPLEA